jgi:3-isopropylmalate/(R)-2-methylmalate dehydratase small subunit
MRGFASVESRAYPLGLKNVDTDLIIPAVHLKTVRRAGLGRFAFEALRAQPGSLFEDPAYKGAAILIAGDNFGCGSSREHAAWALADMGIRAVIAPSFADIFASNAFKNGIATIVLTLAEVDRLLALAAEHSLRIDLEAMEVSAPTGESFAFAMDPFRRRCLIEGLDEIALTLASEAAIRAYELRTGIGR